MKIEKTIWISIVLLLISVTNLSFSLDYNPPLTFPAGENPIQIGVEDLDNNGYLDVITPTSILFGNGDGTLQEPINYVNFDGYYRDVALADINNDNFIDIFTIEENNNNVLIFINQGDGNFIFYEKYLTGSDPNGIKISDINTDGKLDILINNFWNNNVSVFLGSGNLTFQTRRDFSVGDGPEELTVTDLNNDGIDDVVTSNVWSNISVLIGIGDGNFETFINYNEDFSPQDVITADLNKDGFQDVIQGNEYKSYVAVFLGNGDGTLQAPTTFSAGSGVFALEVADLNEDGYDDVLTANYGSQDVSLLISNGDGSLKAPITYPAFGDPHSVVVSDMNNDGIADIVTGNQNSETVTVLLGKKNSIPFEEVTIQAENYDDYFDKTLGNTGGQYRNDDVDIWRSGPNSYYTGANATGEWLNYTIDVPYDGEYRLDIRVATPNSNRRVHVEFDGVDRTGPLTVPNTGWWASWETLSTNVTLSAGRQVMRLVIDNGGLNIDQIALLSSGDLSSVATPTIKPNGGSFTDSVKATLITATANATVYYTTDGSDPYTSATVKQYSAPFTLIEDATVRAYAKKAGMSDSDETIADFIRKEADASAITIQAEDYDLGGQQVAYFDRTPGNGGGQYRQDDVDIWRSGPDKYYTGANSTGEWLNYTIDVPYIGDYRLDIRVATPNSNRRVHVEFDGVDRTGPLTVPNTGWWASWQTLSTNVTLEAGRQVMRLVIDNGGLNVDQISLTILDDDKVWCGDFIGLNFDALAGYTSVTGDLSIEGEWKSWPDFYCSGGEELTTLKIPSLIYVGGDLIIRCVGFRPELTEHGFDNLSRIGGSLKIIGIDGFPLHLREELRDQVLSRDGIGGDIIIEP